METQNKYKETKDFWKPSYNSLRHGLQSEVAWSRLSDAGVQTCKEFPGEREPWIEEKRTSEKEMVGDINRKKKTMDLLNGLYC